MLHQHGVEPAARATTLISPSFLAVQETFLTSLVS
jgi:hypothetical protein